MILYYFTYAWSWFSHNKDPIRDMYSVQCNINDFSLIKWASAWENQRFAYAKTKTQISLAVTAKLISAFVFATWIVQYLYFLNTKFPASSHLQWLYSLVCVRPGQNLNCWFFSRTGSNIITENWLVSLGGNEDQDHSQQYLNMIENW